MVGNKKTKTSKSRGIHEPGMELVKRSNAHQKLTQNYYWTSLGTINSKSIALPCLDSCINLNVHDTLHRTLEVMVSVDADSATTQE